MKNYSFKWNYRKLFEIYLSVKSTIPADLSREIIMKYSVYPRPLLNRGMKRIITINRLPKKLYFSIMSSVHRSRVKLIVLCYENKVFLLLLLFSSLT